MLMAAEQTIIKGQAQRDVVLQIDAQGRFGRIGSSQSLGLADAPLPRTLVLPGFVNAHCHAFARLLRGGNQVRYMSGPAAGWQQRLYDVAEALGPAQLRIVARQVFLDMLLAGVTCAGEFHYLHGHGQMAPHVMAEALSDAARDVGIRISILYTVFLSGHGAIASGAIPQSLRHQSLDAACDAFDTFVDRIIDARDPRLSWGIAAHGLHALPLEALIGLKVRLSHMPFHLGVAPSASEVQACQNRYGVTPVKLLADSQVLDACTTLIDAAHLSADDVGCIARSGAVVCWRPFGTAALDGGRPAALFAAGVPLCLGVDAHAQSSIVHAAQAMNASQPCGAAGVMPAASVLQAATSHGATALGVDTGILASGKWADFVTYDMQHPSLCDAREDQLLATLLSCAHLPPPRDVYVGGACVVRNGVHPQAEQIGRDFAALCHLT